MESFLVLIRALNKGENLEEILKHLSYEDNELSFPVQKLIKVDSWSSFKDALKHTIYYRSIETYDHLDDSNLFELEKTLERSFYDLQFKRLKSLKDKGSQNLVKLLRAEIDMLNLIWIYRAKKFYHYTADQILPYIYRGGLVVRENDLRRLAETDDFEEFLELLRSYKRYEFLFDHYDKNLDLHMDRREKRYLYFQFTNLIAFSKAFSAAYSYLRLLLDEIDDIISIIEAKRYNLNNEETLQYLVRRLVL